MRDEGEELLAEEEPLEEEEEEEEEEATNEETEAAAPTGLAGSVASGQTQTQTQTQSSSPQQQQQQQVESQESDSDSDESSSSDFDRRRISKLRPRAATAVDVLHPIIAVPTVPGAGASAGSASAAYLSTDSDDGFEEQLDTAEPDPVEPASTTAASTAAAVADADADADAGGSNRSQYSSTGVRSLGRGAPGALSKIESDMHKMIELRKAKNRAARMRLAEQNPTTAARVAAADGA